MYDIPVFIKGDYLDSVLNSRVRERLSTIRFREQKHNSTYSLPN